MRATLALNGQRVDVPVAIRATKNLENTMFAINYLSELPKFCEQWELTFLLTIASRAAKIPTTLKVDIHFSITYGSATQ